MMAEKIPLTGYSVSELQTELVRRGSADERNQAEDLAKLADAFFEHLNIDDCEYGAIGIDCKAPFGNSDVQADMLKIIGWEAMSKEGYTDEQESYVNDLHHARLIPYLRSKWKEFTAPSE